MKLRGFCLYKPNYDVVFNPKDNIRILISSPKYHNTTKP